MTQYNENIELGSGVLNELGATEILLNKKSRSFGGGMFLPFKNMI